MQSRAKVRTHTHTVHRMHSAEQHRRMHCSIAAAEAAVAEAAAIISGSSLCLTMRIILYPIISLDISFLLSHSLSLTPIAASTARGQTVCPDLR